MNSNKLSLLEQVVVNGVTRCVHCGSSRKHWKNTGTNALVQQAQPDLRDAMIEVLESTPYSSIEFAPGMRFLKETIIAGLTQQRGRITS